MEIPEYQRHIYDYFIDEYGNWFCEGNPVEDPDLFRLLSRTLFEKGGKYFIRCEGEVHPVRVADAPLWIKYLHKTVDPKGNLAEVTIELTDGRKEKLDTNSLCIRGDSAIYCLATKRRLLARFGKIAYYELAQLLEWDEQKNKYFLPIGGKKIEIKKCMETGTLR